MICFAYCDSPVGILKLGYTENTVVALSFSHKIDGICKSSKFSDSVFVQIKEYFSGIRRSFDFPYRLHGTDFQKKVYKALEAIPYGETRTYKDIAVSIGNANSCRAVGSACNRNPIAIVVPCHRVIGSSGKLTGYAGGLGIKRTLLMLETFDAWHK